MLYRTKVRVMHSIEELELLERCKTKNEFKKAYHERFGVGATTEEMYNTVRAVNSIWDNRDRNLERLKTLRVKTHTVYVPKEIVHKSNGTKPLVFSEDAVLVNIHNLLAEVVQLQKESIKIANAQFALFANLAKKDEQKVG
jgi:hypothetical protein